MTRGEAVSLEDLVRILVKRSSANHEQRGQFQQDSQIEEVLFDLEVDGTRYLFIQLPKLGQPHAQLSPREQEIVRLVALGHSNKIIAGVLNISSWTVCTHVRRIFNKLGVGSRAAMVARASEIDRTRGSASISRKLPGTETNARSHDTVSLVRNSGAAVASLREHALQSRSG